jgi:hypothetical protein
MGFLSFLTQGKRGPDEVTKTSSTQTVSLPSWYTDYAQNQTALASKVGSQPYKPYLGPRVAGLSTDEREAGNYARSNMGAWQDQFGQAAEMTARGGQGYDPADVGRFMNPHIGAVVDEIGRLGREGFNAVGGTADNLRSEFVGSGGFGSTRNMDALARASNENERNILGQQSMALNQGFDTAMRNMGTWADRDLTAGGQMGALAQMRQGLDVNSAAMLDAVGEKERGITQAGYDVGYGDYLDERDFGVNRMLAAAQGTSGLQIPTTTTGTGTQTTPGQYQASPLQTLTGLVGLGYGMKSLFKKDGGHVRGYKRGGRVKCGGLRMVS